MVDEVDLLKKSILYIVIVNERFVRSEESMYNCKLAAKLGKPMMAIIKQGTDFSQFEHFPWLKRWYFADNGELLRVSMEIAELRREIEKQTGQKTWYLARGSEAETW